MDLDPDVGVWCTPFTKIPFDEMSCTSTRLNGGAVVSKLGSVRIRGGIYAEIRRWNWEMCISVRTRSLR